MSITKTEFTIEKVKNGFILDNENIGKNVFLDKESISVFVSKSLVNSLKYNEDKLFKIRMEIENPIFKKD